MQHNITLFADQEIADALKCHIKASCPHFIIGYLASSYADCLEPSIQNHADVFIIQAKPPITCVDDLLFDLQSAGFSPIYILFQVSAPGKIRYAATSSVNPLANTVNKMFRDALKDLYFCEYVCLRTTILADDSHPNSAAMDRHESLMEILRGCNQQEFLLNRVKYGLDLRNNGYYLFFWELMGFEFTDHETNKFIYNFSGEMLMRECYEIIGCYNGGEVFYCTPNLLCIIINDLNIKSEAKKSSQFEELVSRLAHCTGNRIAVRYLSERAGDIKSLRFAYEKYHAEKSIAFFLRDMNVIRPSAIESRKRYTDGKIVNTLLYEITDLIRHDLMNPVLESKLHKMFFDILKPAMSFTLYYSNTAAIYNAVAEVEFSVDNIVPTVNDSPNLLQFSSIEDQYRVMLKRIRELQPRINVIKRTKNTIVLKAMNYIADNYSRDISIGDISGALFVSNVHLSQVFKREMGVSVIKYLIRYRLEQARKLLQETDDYIYLVAEKVGFHDFRHFSSAFKEATGVTPTQYRKQYRCSLAR